LAFFQGQHLTEYSLLAAAGTIVALPIVVLYFLPAASVHLRHAQWDLESLSPVSPRTRTTYVLALFG
jgi:hypothetical protein